MFKSLRWKFTAWYVGASVLAVLVVGVAVFFMESRVLDQRLDGSIRSAGDAARAATAANLERSLTADPLTAAELAIETVASHHGLTAHDVFVILLDRDGRIVSNPDNIPATSAFDFSIERALAEGADWRNVQAPDGDLRVKTFPLMDQAGDVIGFVQAGKSVEDGEAALRTLALVMTGAGLIGLVLFAVGGYVVAGKAIQPVQQSFERQRQFVADASHELRTPLAVIRTNTGALLRHDPRDESLQDIDFEARYMSRLIDNLLMLANGDRGQIRLELAEADLSEVARSAARAAQTLATEAGLSFQLDLADGLPVTTDVERCRQVVLILMDNALAYTPRGGSVSLSTRRSGSEGLIEVRDSGPGMSKEELARATDRFYSGSKARSRSGGNAGLGLSIATELMSALDGKLELESEPGNGTTARLRLPLRQLTEPVTATPRLERGQL
jgi:signal transduction histidine kinase